MNYEKFIADLAGPLLRYPQEMIVKKFAEDDEKIVIHIMVNSEDIGRIIVLTGKNIILYINIKVIKRKLRLVLRKKLLKNCEK
jgi:predicted RNA-binding protein YlqC (UPF0109 family)